MSWCLEIAKENLPHYKGEGPKLNIVCESDHFEMHGVEKQEPTEKNCSCNSNEFPGKCLTCSESPFRIVFRGAQLIVVAKSKDQDSLFILWDQLQQEIQPMISTLEKEQLKEYEKKQAATTSKNKTLLQRLISAAPECSNPTFFYPPRVTLALQDFVMIKISALIKARKDFQKKKSTICEDIFPEIFANFTETPQISKIIFFNLVISFI